MTSVLDKALLKIINKTRIVRPAKAREASAEARIVHVIHQFESLKMQIFVVWVWF